MWNIELNRFSNKSELFWTPFKPISYIKCSHHLLFGTCVCCVCVSECVCLQTSIGDSYKNKQHIHIYQSRSVRKNLATIIQYKPCFFKLHGKYFIVFRSLPPISQTTNIPHFHYVFLDCFFFALCNKYLYFYNNIIKDIIIILIH